MAGRIAAGRGLAITYKMQVQQPTKTFCNFMQKRLAKNTDANNNPIIETTKKYHPDGYIPDWEFMEKYIRAIEKIVIADVVQYKDAMISKTKEVVA